MELATTPSWPATPPEPISTDSSAQTPTIAQAANLQVHVASPDDDAAECAAARPLVTQLLMWLEPKLSADLKKEAAPVLDDAKALGRSEADGYNAFAAGAMLQGLVDAAAWGALKAALLEWDVHHVGNAGVYLLYLDRLDDAQVLLDCAASIDPDVGAVVEAQAILASRRQNFRSAKALIERAIFLLPGDMNVLYTAGIIHYDAGDHAAAAVFLQRAQHIAPDDKTVQEALKIIDPSTIAPPPTPSDALARQISECFQFMDDMVIQTDAAEKLAREIEEARLGPNAGQYDMTQERREWVALIKEQITLLEQQARTSAAAGDPYAPIAWNLALASCITTYFGAIAQYGDVLYRETPSLVMAESLGLSASAAAARSFHAGGHVRNPVSVFLDERKRLEDSVGLLAEQLTTRIQQCPRVSLATGDALPEQACYNAAMEDYCAAAEARWEIYADQVIANARAADGAFNRAAAEYLNHWLYYADQARDFAKRTLEVMKPVKAFPGMTAAMVEDMAREAGPSAMARQVQEEHERTVARLLNDVASELWNTYESLESELQYVPHGIVIDWEHHAKSSYCQNGKPRHVALDAEIEALLAAFAEAGSYDAAFKPECEFEIGGVTFAISQQGIQVQRSKDGANISTTIGRNQRAGIAAGVSRSKSFSGPYGLRGSGGVTTWVESGPHGPDFGVQFSGKVGIGVGTDGLSAGCYPLHANATFTARAFARALHA